MKQKRGGFSFFFAAWRLAQAQTPLWMKSILRLVAAHTGTDAAMGAEK
ncbi:MAG: hypothetical protein K2M45_10665 [Muribaculaceae bacterium]|nr:hypothetical protein [Muribaculaceae bacterium]